MKVACIYVSLGEAKRSGATVGPRLASQLNGWEAFSVMDVDYDALRKADYKIFTFNHKPDLFKRKLCYDCLQDIINTRQEWAQTIVGRSCISGLSYWKRYAHLYKAFMPTVVDYSVSGRCTDVPVLGYYSRSIRLDSNDAFVDLANRTPLEVPIIVMGSPLPSIKRPYVFTTDEDYFFRQVTHYFYWKSWQHDDVWPHTLLQAAQVGCVLVVPERKRNFEDGIDDILHVCTHVSHSRPWELDISQYGCRWAPKFSDLKPLYDHIQDSNWTWLPELHWSFNDLLNYSQKL